MWETCAGLAIGNVSEPSFSSYSWNRPLRDFRRGEKEEEMLAYRQDGS
jgi:hypothetical protein